MCMTFNTYMHIFNLHACMHAHIHMRLCKQYPSIIRNNYIPLGCVKSHDCTYVASLPLQDLFGYKIELLPVQYIMAILDYVSADILKVSL